MQPKDMTKKRNRSLREEGQRLCSLEKKRLRKLHEEIKDQKTWQDQAVAYAKKKCGNASFRVFGKVVACGRQPLPVNNFSACIIKQLQKEGLVAVSEGFVMINTRASMSKRGICSRN